MGSERIFVGRKGELARFREVLRDPGGQAVVVGGAAGMGKRAQSHLGLKCEWMRGL